MKLFGFGREKEVPEDSEPSEEEGEGQEEEGEVKRGKGKPRKRSGRESRSGEGAAERAAANVERLAAKVEALFELRKTDAERFPRISEQIGELRNLILDKEAQIKEVEAKAVKAAETIEELRPENIISEVRKSEAKYQALEARIEATTALYNKVMVEFKALRKKLAMFHGVDELVKLNEETGSNLANIKRTEASIESQANKIGNVYTQFQKRTGELARYKDAAASLQEDFNSIKDSVEELKAKAQSALVSQEDLNGLRAQLRSELNKGIGGLGKTITELAAGRVTAESASKVEKELRELKVQLASYASQKKASERLIVDTLNAARKRLAEGEKAIRSLVARLKGFKERLYKMPASVAKGSAAKERQKGQRSQGRKRMKRENVRQTPKSKARQKRQKKT